ncbi:MAG: hypothetical protein ACOVQX_03025 [Legionella sp.]
MSILLPFANTDKTMRVPSKDCLLKCMEIISTPESASYFHEQLKQILASRNLMSKFGDVLNIVDEFANNISAQSSPSSHPWTGNFIVSNTAELHQFQNMQQNLAIHAAGELQTQFITLDYILTEDAKFRQAYSSGGNVISGNEEAALDTLFNAWLALNGMMRLDGTIYQIDPNSKDIQPLKNSQGGFVIADVKKLTTLIGSDGYDGFKGYVCEKNNSIKINTSMHQLAIEPTPDEKKLSSSQGF